MEDKIDDLDLRFILQLQENCRLSMIKLSDKVGCSRPTTMKRLKRLIGEGIVMVAGNMTKFGYKMASIGIEVKSSEAMAELEECLTHCPRVINMFRTTGKANLHMSVWGEDDRALNSTVESMRETPNVDVVYAYYLGTPIHGEVLFKVHSNEDGTPPCEKKCTDCHRYEDMWCPGCPVSSAYRKRAPAPKWQVGATQTH